MHVAFSENSRLLSHEEKIAQGNFRRECKHPPNEAWSPFPTKRKAILQLPLIRSHTAPERYSTKRRPRA
jgi:hypothetical protein